MLDDCRGDKFWEVLAVFSTSVVKRRLIAGKQGKQVPVSLRLATLPSLSAKQQRSLLPLSIAHKASLSASLTRRQALKERYASLVDLLDGKMQQLQDREQRARSKPATLPPAELASMRKQLEGSWLANGQWIGVLLHGEDDTGDQILGQSFDSIWRATSAGESLYSILPESGLLDDLELRVERQKRRLAHWKDFYNKLQDPSERSAADQAKDRPDTQELSTRFNQHHALKINGEAANGDDSGALDPNNVADVLPMSPQHQNLVESMRRELGNATASSRPGSSRVPATEAAAPAPSRLRPFRLSSSTRHDFSPTLTRKQSADVTRRISVVGLGSHKSTSSVGSAASQQSDADNPVRIRPFSTFSPLSWAASQAHSAGTSPILRQDSDATSPRAPRVTSPSALASPSSDPLREVTEEEALAEKIVSSVADASPSPVKQTMLSLTERTRMSIAHNSLSQPGFSEVSSDEEADMSPNRSSAQLPPEADRRTSLLERTRQSMSLLPGNTTVSQKPRKSIVATQKKRQTLFPINQFETPRRQPSMTLSEYSEGNDGRSATPKELLFSEEAEYASVFRSRPKVAVSPVNTPQEDDIGSLDGAMDGDTSFASSPLGRMGLGVSRGG